MNKESRTFNSIRNIVVATIAQMVSMVIGLVLRTFFIQYLGNEYLGINTLFTSVLNIISMAEMGFTTVAVVSLYQPIAEKNLSRMAQYVQYYRKAYLVIAGLTLAVGVALTPFLGILVNTEQDIRGLYVYYWLFVLNSAVSYLSNYKLLVIKACQKEYLISKQTMYVNIAFTIVQIIAMLTFHNYILYLLLMIGETFFTNFAASTKLKKIYPDFSLKNVERLEKKERVHIWKDIYSNFTYKIGTLLLSNSGDIFISTFAGTGVLGIYSNYAIFLNLMKSVLKSVYQQVYNSIGDLNHSESTRKREEIFEVCVFVYAFLITVALCGIFCLGDSAIILWLGSDYLISRGILAAACINHYFYMMSYPVLTFRVTSKYIKESRYLSLIAAVIAITAGIILGPKIGIVGVLLSLALARVSTLFWYEPYILYKKAFEGSFGRYMLKQLKYFVTIVGICVIQSWIFSYYTSVSIFHFVVKIIISVLVSVGLFFVVNCRTRECKYLFGVARNILRK